MRLPLATELKTRPGDNTKDARLKNSYAEVRGEQTVVRKRSGSTDEGLAANEGDSQLLSCWEGLLAITGDALYLFFDDLEYIIDWSNASEWDAGATYDSSDWVWYNNQLWHWVSGTTGVAPASGAWETVELLSYDEDATYDIGDAVRVDSVTYYSYMTSNTGNTPSASSEFWKTTPPPAARYYCYGAAHDPAERTGAVCATKTSAAYAWYALLTNTSCPPIHGSNWFTGPLTIGVTYVDGRTWVDPSGGSCSGTYSVPSGPAGTFVTA